MRELVTAGRATAPTVRSPITAPAEHDATVDVAAALTTDRDEERW
ncbi:hypothetical protein [Saccharomonospora cyanea]|uniref:Uncharacterized protein n=1 Tax=Saccharomonospora cyanea NA-134 TaxID=882082 RepID=H5XQF3_9PSEU|nr:hypothetical protein [Saccharomonospora cyanea]EHR63886.1 hypothetical protein SaccyDRAFT_5092 [Saccharomonospora cyanea NA-134]